MNLTKHNTLSIAEGLRIQGQHLAEWKPRLSALAYEALAAECARQNSQLDPIDDGYSVFRGGDFPEFLSNLYL
jgi:hypothetical protein